MSQAVPFWVQLPSDAQRDLSGAGFVQQWFDKQPEPIRLTLLNLYVKLSGVKLWQHVKTGQVVGPGILNFQAKNVALLKQELRDRRDFGSPEKSSDAWSSSEKNTNGMLHFKHDKKWGHDPVTVQAHIDPVGWTGWDPATILEHWANYSGYKEIYRIRDILLWQYGDQVLLGVSGSRDASGSQ